MSGRGPKPGGSFQKIQKTLTTIQKAAAGCQIDSELQECLTNFKGTAAREPDVAARLVAEAHGLPFLVARHAREFANGVAHVLLIGVAPTATASVASGGPSDMSVHWGVVEAAAHVVAAATHASPFEGRSAADVSHGHKAVSSLQWRQWFRAVLEAAVVGIQSSGALQRLDAADAAGSAAAAGAARPVDVPTPDQLRLSSTLAALVALCGKLSRQPPAIGRGAWRKPLTACAEAADAATSALSAASGDAGAGQPACGAWLAESRITDDDGGDDDDEGAGDDEEDDDEEEEEDGEAAEEDAGTSVGSDRKGVGYRGTGKPGGSGVAVQPPLPLLHSLLTSNTVAWLRTPAAPAAGTAGIKTSAATPAPAGCIADAVHAQLAVVTRYLQAAMVTHGPELRPVELAGPALLRLNILQAEMAGLCSASSLTPAHTVPEGAGAEATASLVTSTRAQLQQQRSVALLLQSIALQRIGAGVAWALLTAVHLCRRLPASQALLEILLSEARAGVEYIAYAAYRQTASGLAASGGGADGLGSIGGVASVGGADAAARTGLQQLLGGASEAVFAFVPPLVATTKAWLAAVLFAASRKGSDAAAGHTRRKASHKAGAGSAGSAAASGAGADSDGTPTASASAPGSVIDGSQRPEAGRGDDKFHDAYFVTSGVSPASGREVANEVQAAADGILAAAAHAAAAACLWQRASPVDGSSVGATAPAVLSAAAAALLGTVAAPTHTAAPQIPVGDCADASVAGTAAAHALWPTASVLCWPWHKTAARYGTAAPVEAAAGQAAASDASAAASIAGAAVAADAPDASCSPQHLLALLAAPDARVPQLLLRACAWGICAQSASSGPESAAAHVIAPPEVVTALHAVVPVLLAAAGGSARAPNGASAYIAGGPAPAGEEGSEAALLTHEASFAAAARAATAKSPAFLSHALDAVVAATSAAACFHGAAAHTAAESDAVRRSLSPLLRAVWRPLAAALPQGHRYSSGMQKVVLSSVKRVLAAGDTLLRALETHGGSGTAAPSDALAAGSTQAEGAIAAELAAVLQPAEAAQALLAYVLAARVELVPALARAARARQSATLAVLLQLQAGAAGPVLGNDGGSAPAAPLLPPAAPAALHADAANLLLEAAAQAAGLALRIDSVLATSATAPSDAKAETEAAGGDAALTVTRDTAAAPAVASPAVAVMAALSDAVADGLRILRLKESSAGLPPLQVVQPASAASTPVAAATGDAAAAAASPPAEAAALPTQPAVAPVRKRGVRFAGAEEEGLDEGAGGATAGPASASALPSGASAPVLGLGGMADDEEAEGEVETLGHFTASAAALLTALLRRLPAAAPSAALSGAADAKSAGLQHPRHLRAACAAVLRPVVQRSAAEPVVFDEDGLLDSLGADLLAAL